MGTPGTFCDPDLLRRMLAEATVSAVRKGDLQSAETLQTLAEAYRECTLSAEDYRECARKSAETYRGGEKKCEEKNSKRPEGGDKLK